MDVADASHATSAIIASGVVPAALEFMDSGVIRVVEQSIFAAGYPIDAAAILLIEVDGTVESTDADMDLVRKLCMECGARSVRVATNETERARLWQGRKKAFGAMGRLAPNLAVQDAVIPRTRLAEVLAQIHAIADSHGVTVCNVFHAGDGNLHPNISYDAGDPDQVRRVHESMAAMMQACIAAGGSITGEHGVGLDKLRYMPLLFDEPTLAAMCDLRTAFDPAQRSNPGKVVPVHSCREWHGAPAVRAGEIASEVASDAR
jgi:FAD/FMN-containing dehydrogenase